jgi:hypothetical protein
MPVRALALAVLMLFAAVASAQEGNARALAIAKRSRDSEASLQFIRQAVEAMPAKALEDVRLKQETLALLDNPAPTFMKRLATPEAREGVRKELVKAGLLDASVTVAQLFPPLANPALAPQSFLSAPGSILHGHHSYPGGLVQHTAFNLRAALDLARNYTATYGSNDLHRGLLVAAPVWHDAMKTWCLQWKADGTQTFQPMIADAGSHHVFVVAEAFFRKMSPEFIVTVASAHDAPAGKTADRVVKYLRAGAMLAGVDPVAAGVLNGSKDTFELTRPASFEALVNHLADHDYVLMDPAQGVVDSSLDRLIKDTAVGRPLSETALRWTRYRVESRVSGMRLYSAWRVGGDDRLREMLKDMNVPLTAEADK